MTKGLLRSMPIQAVAIFGTVLLCGISAVNALASAPAVLEQMDNAFVQVAEKVTPAVVNISSTKKEEQGPGGPDLEQFFKNFPPFRDFHGDESFKKFKKGPGKVGVSDIRGWVRA